MQAVKEITKWADGSDANHTYLLDGDNMLAYIPRSTTEAVWFKKPIKISRSGRKFETVATDVFNNWAKLIRAHVQVAQQIANVRQVQGSKPGVWYTVNLDQHSCTCSGFQFRGACKHVKELA